MIKTILVDDHKIIRHGIRSLLKEEPGIEVVGEASNGQELLDMLANMPADIIILDLNMPVMDGFEATEQVRKQYPAINILILSMLDHENYITKILDAGALGYVLKNTGKEEIIYAIKSVAAGKHFIGTEIALGLLRRIQVAMTKPEPNTRQPGDLSKREIEVLRLIAEGFTNAEIAEKLFTSKRTIESHRQHLIEKTQAKNTAALVKFALEKGIIE